MKRISLLALGVMVGIGLAATSARAQGPVALVEDLNGNPAGVEFMDYVPAGKVIRLGPKDSIVLGYMKSCWRETITGGTVTTGPEQSRVEGGKLERSKTDCDGGKMQLTAQQASKSGAMVFRSGPRQTTLPTAQIILYGLSPVVEVKGGGKLVIERLDQPGEKVEVNIADHQLMRGAFFDFAKSDRAFVAGGLYKATVGTSEIVFKVDPFAQPGQAPIVGRLLRFQPAG